ncbi:MAG: coproporphyrinogen III oxidase family protein [Clostridia bacterium]|nr:coproporphyrinogen III oxidase family protein [Clostridia bacterium]
MANQVAFTEKLTNFYRYPCICGFQDKVEKPKEFLGYLNTPSPKDRDTMIYIHIPFCRSMCIYCPFYKEHHKNIDYETKSRFVNALVKELEMYSKEPYFKDVPIVNVNMGGGTPMVLETELLIRILDAIYKNFNMEKCEVISIEGDPIALQDVNKLKALKEMGMTRTSFGIQTFNERLRKKLGVESSVLDIFKALNALEKAGVDEWGCDMLYNCPDQNVTEIRYNVDRICDLKPTVVDVYDLNISPNTKLQKLLDTDYFKSKPSNKNEIEMFAAIMETFGENGFDHIRSVNFEPKGYKHSKKGILYAFSADLLAIGPSARTFMYSGGMNYRNHCSLERYIGSLEDGIYPVEAGNIVSKEALEERDIILFPYYMKLRKDEINYNRFKEKIDDMIISGYIKDNGDSIELTDLGKLWAGNVQYYFHSDSEKEKMANSIFKCLSEKKNFFNQDNINC